MFKKMWRKFKSFFGGYVKKEVTKAIDGLDEYEDDLAEEIDRRWNSEKIAKKSIDFVQKKLKEILNQIL